MMQLEMNLILTMFHSLSVNQLCIGAFILPKRVSLNPMSTVYRNTLYANLSFMDWLYYWSYLISFKSKCYFYKLYCRKLDENRNILKNDTKH